MDNAVTAFAAIKTFYDTGNDLIDVFGNIILLVLKDEKGYSTLEVQASFLDKIKFNIPTDVLRTILKRLKKNSFVNYENLQDVGFSSIRITEEGKYKRTKIESEFLEAKREETVLMLAIQQYISKKNGYKFPLEYISNIFNNFVTDNISGAVFTLEREKEFSGGDISNGNNHIISYFIESEKEDPANFERVKVILYGRIIANTFLNRRFEGDSKLDNLNIYLDTNIVFSLMGFHDDFDNKNIEEVISLIKNAGCYLKIFSFTKDEITRVLSGYLRDYSFYSEQIIVDSIYFALKKKGYTVTDIIHLIESIDDKLKEFGVEVDYSYDAESLVLGKDAALSKLAGYKKSTSTRYALQHDLAVILAVQKIRNKNRVFLWEKSHAIFLSSDTQLSLYDFKEHEHENQRTVPEVIFRSDMTSMLWLKGCSGSDNAFVHSFTANYARGAIISTDLWNKFVVAIKSKLKTGIITQQNVEEIIVLHDTGKILREKGESGIEEILNDERMALLKEKKQKQEEEAEANQKLILDQTEKLQLLEEIALKKEREKQHVEKEKQDAEKLILDQAEKLEHFLKVIVSECKTTWTKIINIGVGIIALFLFCIVAYFVNKFGVSTVANILQLFTLGALLLVAISLIKKEKFRFIEFLVDFRVNLENKMISKCVEKKKIKYGFKLNVPNLKKECVDMIEQKEDAGGKSSRLHVVIIFGVVAGIVGFILSFL